MSSADQDRLVFNGIDGATGEYLLPAMTPQEVAALACGESPAPAHLRELQDRRHWASRTPLGPCEGVDPRRLAEAGWGVIFPHDVDPAVKEALAELLDHRRAQATRQSERFFRVYDGESGYQPGETKPQFLARHGVAPGPADPGKMPYYLLLVGSPTAIPFRFQYQLDVQYAVGRLDFDQPEEYASYARTVVAAERWEIKRRCRAAFFGVRNPGDRPTELSHDHLVRPLAEAVARDHPDWRVTAVLAEEARKARLGELLLGGEETPSLLFTASHGVGFPNGHPRQLPHQGALLCQDWPGPGTGKPCPDLYLAAADVGAEARLNGLVAFHFACYGAGTPEREDPRQDFAVGRTLAPHDFVARLPRRLLSHPRGGALAVVGHVDRAWSYSFHWPQAGVVQRGVFVSTLKRLLTGHPVGSAMEHFNLRYAELASDLASAREEIDWGKTPDDRNLTRLWTAHNDARSFVVLGDPAVRLPLAGVDAVAG